MKLPSYKRYKDSGMPWIGSIPTHWNCLNLRQILTGVSIRNQPEFPLLSVVREKGIVKRDITSKESNHNFIPDDLSNYKVVRKSQFVMNKMKAWQGSYGISNFDGIVSPAYYVFDTQNVYVNFFHTAIRSKIYIPFFTKSSDGVRVGQWDLNINRMKEIPFFIPIFDEQIGIYKFIKWKIQDINKLIRNKRRLIELLKEQKQNIINQAVTRGINQNVKLKPSGVDWIGDIPEHWKVMPVKRAFSHIVYGTSESSKDEGRYIVLGMGNIKEGEIHTRGCGKLTDIHKDLILQPNDLLFNRTNSMALVGKVGIFRGSAESEVTFASYLVMMRTNGSVIPEFMNYLLNSKAVLSFARQQAIPSLHQCNLNPTRYGRIPVPIPPIVEQEIIVKWIAGNCHHLDEAILRAEREIALIREYRTRLISDVVTGKVDVRGIEIPDFDENEAIEPESDGLGGDDLPDTEGEEDEDD